MGHTAYLSCVPCDGRATVLLVPGRTESFGVLLRQSLVMPVGGRSLLLVIASLLSIHAVRGATSGASALIVPAVFGLLALCVFMAILQLSIRGAELTDVQTLGGTQEILFPAVRLGALVLPLAWGLGVIAGHAAGLATLLFILVGGVLGPFWCLSAARGDGLGTLLRPGIPLSIAQRLGADGVRLCAFTSILMATLAWWWRSSRMADETLAPLALFLDVAVVLGVLVGARLVGAVAAARADALDLPWREDLLTPALPNARPRGVRSRRPEPVPERPRPAFIEL